MSSVITTLSRSATGFSALSPSAARALLACVVLTAAAIGYWADSADSSARAAALAGADLTRLLRAMALLKAVVAAGAAAAVYWRLGAPVAWPWLAGYLAGGAAMAAGPGVIWGMAHVGIGAALLHGGLLAMIVLLWRDPAVGARLSVIVAARRAALRVGGR